ncbi:hypothetical protein [Microvirga sp. BSC39]|uniref:hypothetical protein n=1 Tax=Microvirga sp. BSC39 TaxID=1549810 RepID=UPI0004E90942|nr:hypothetical protein [Microvirga sp. BSC39]KFG68129.1 hypothetical protein JH26_18025 [Microvirga sp. BSC39]
MAYIPLTENNDTQVIYNVTTDDSDEIFHGLGGDDTFLVNTFLVNNYVYGISISGSDSAGFRSELQWDVVHLAVSARFNALSFIDVLTFTSPNSATTLTYSANSSFGVSQVVGSTAGIDTIHFTSASERVNLDLSGTVFANWGRAN